MNYEFIKNKDFSLKILSSMIFLFQQLKNNEDQRNIIFIIKNILKGAKENKLFFLENDGTQNFA